MAGKVKYHKLTEFEKKKYLGEFYDMVSSLNSRDEVKKFFKDLLTLSEIVMISRRIQVAKMLLEGLTYDEIQKTLKIGKTTIAQVEKWLYDGFGGYQEAIIKFNQSGIKKSGGRIPETPFSLKSIRNRYPLHFLLLNLVKK